MLPPRLRERQKSRHKAVWWKGREPKLKLKAENVSSVFVTHNIYHAYQVCDRFVIMSHGTKVFDVHKADTTISQLTEYVVLT